MSASEINNPRRSQRQHIPNLRLNRDRPLLPSAAIQQLTDDTELSTTRVGPTSNPTTNISMEPLLTADWAHGRVNSTQSEANQQAFQLHPSQLHPPQLHPSQFPDNVLEELAAHIQNEVIVVA